MITIKNYAQFKKFASFAFKLKNSKLNLSQFKTELSRYFGNDSLEYSFKEADKKKLEAFQENYITILDDPRITLEVAREIGDDYDKATKYFKTHLTDSANILNPVKSGNELLARCEEILILWQEAEWFSQKNLLRLLIKQSMPHSRLAYQNTFDDELNAEVKFALSLISKQNGSTFIDLAKKSINIENCEFYAADGYSEIREKLEIFLSGIIWTKTHVGSFMYEKSDVYIS